MTGRTLRLRREPLAELTSDELTGVVGAALTLLSCTWWLPLTQQDACRPAHGPA